MAAAASIPRAGRDVGRRSPALPGIARRRDPEDDDDLDEFDFDDPDFLDDPDEFDDDEDDFEDDDDEDDDEEEGW